MVLCAIFGCGMRSVHDKGICIARLPSVITNQGEEVSTLSEERGNKWISAISREDLTDSILIGAWPSLWETFYFWRSGKTVG